MTRGPGKVATPGEELPTAGIPAPVAEPVVVAPGLGDELLLAPGDGDRPPGPSLGDTLGLLLWVCPAGPELDEPAAPEVPLDLQVDLPVPPDVPVEPRAEWPCELVPPGLRWPPPLTPADPPE